MIIGGKNFDTERHTYVMGILNVTPDSFSDGGKWCGIDNALRHTEEMISQGVEILDIGGESTRPGYTFVEPEEEIERVVPVIRAIKERFDIPVSLDTYKAQVAEAGIGAGADLINDIWGLKYDGRMAKVIAESGVCCCLMHNRKHAEYQDFLPDTLADLKESLRIAQEAGIASEKIIVDPGVGFAKNYDQNLEVLANLERYKCFDLPVLLGCSRKSVIGLTLDLPASEREEGTLATTVMAVMKGMAFVRVHDVEKNVRAIRMTEAVLKKEIR